MNRGSTMNPFSTTLLFVVAIASQTGAVKVVVIGAGAAGLAAARTLQDNWNAAKGELDLVVMEGRDRIGGRIHTVQNAVGWPSAPLGGEADMGASWIHGSAPAHPVTKIKEALGLATTITHDYKAILHACNDAYNVNAAGAPACPTSDFHYQEYVTMVSAAQAAAENYNIDPTLWSALDGITGPNLIDRNSKIFQYNMAGTEFSYGSSMTNLGAWWYNDDSWHGGPEEVFLKGYTTITDSLAAGTVKLNTGSPALAVTSNAVGSALTVQLSTKVNAVTYAGGSFQIATAGGSTVTADYVIVTVPLGVLKAGSLTFSPPLPSTYTNAITKLGFGNVNKLALLFDTPWWKAAPTYDNQHWFHLAQAGAAERGLFTYWLNLEPMIGKPVLMTFGVGDAAFVADDLSDAEAWAKAKVSLIKIFGASIVPAAASAILRSNWGNDDFAKGTYSYVAPGTKKSTFQTFQTPANDGKLMFAGEHTSGKYRGTVHGAIDSGQLAARHILDTVPDALPAATGAPSAPTSSDGTGGQMTCSQLGWTTIVDNVCGESDDGISGGCQSAPLEDARIICSNAKARLCTTEEVNGGATTATGCGFDADHVWTDTWCGLGPEGGKYYTAIGGGNNREWKCKNPKKSYNVRCCSDVSLAGTAVAAATTTTTFPFLSERKNCASLRWEVVGNACGESDRAFKKGLDHCFTNKNHPDAERKCLKLGGRMCSQADIEAGVGKSTGCNFDTEFLWTSTACGTNSYIKARGSGDGATECAVAKSKGAMRCCSDVALRATTLQAESNSGTAAEKQPKNGKQGTQRKHGKHGKHATMASLEGKRVEATSSRFASTRTVFVFCAALVVAAVLAEEVPKLTRASASTEQTGPGDTTEELPVEQAPILNEEQALNGDEM